MLRSVLRSLTVLSVALPLLPFSVLAQAKQVTVALTGKADFHSLTEALASAPIAGETIRLAPGTYREKLRISTPSVHLIGLGKRPEDVVISWNDSAASAGGTSKSGTLTVTADGFAAENLTIENTWEKEHTRTEEGSQAVALLLSSDRAVLDRVRLLGAQDTLYANSQTCHAPATAAVQPTAQAAPQGAAREPAPDSPPCRASRQYFRDCYIAGHVDFIFGDAKAVFDHCELHAVTHETVMLTAQSRHFPAEDSGYTFLHSRVTGDPGVGKLVLGRPWRDYSTVTFYDTSFDFPVAPEGWWEWGGRLHTSTYREYKSHGRGVNGGSRVVVSPELTRQEEAGMTPKGLLSGLDGWDPVAAANELRRVH